jgi:GAF domain-containing protein
MFVVIQLLCFGGTGIWLLIANAEDARTTYLGAVLLLIASAFATGHYADLAQLTSMGGWLIPVYPDSFLGYYLARFIAEFPPRDPQSPSARLIRILGALALGAGWSLFVANAIVGWHLFPGLSKWASPLLRRSAGGTIYWTLVFVVVLLLLIVALTGTQPLPAEERRRVRVFWGAFAIGFAPLVAIVVLGVVPHVGPAATQWALTGVPLFYVHASLASIPLTVSYAVLVRRILPVRVVVRQAVRYLLARSVVTAGFLIPLVFLILHSYTHRNLTIAQAFSGHFRTLAAIGGVAGLALLCREDILRFLDRRFFREEYDAREVLVRLTGESRRVHRIEELVALVTAGIDRALRPEPVAILVRDRSRSQFVSPFGSVEPLPCSSVLADILNASNEPLDVSLQPAHGLAWLPRAERQWLVDSRSRLLLALRASDGGLLGLVTLGERKSELPFSREDRRLLIAIAESAALTIEHHAVRSESAEEDDWWRVGAAPHGSAMECEACGRVQVRVEACVECGGVVLEAQVPRLMFGKFQFERRVGRGAMGIVYEVRDLSLDRTVAIKTLPGTSPEHAERLRLEAKAMAAVTHPNLATIHGAESWRGRPMLVCEFMAHGTLADRLVHSVLTVNETLALGIALADALRVIHGAGLLHRDIKPSNIGFAHDSSPKLLDFGLVRMLAAGGVRSQAVSDREESDPLASLTMTNSLIGTPLYLAPEAIAGSAPSVSFDLWSLNVLLLEAATGHHPFRAQSIEETLRRVCECGVTELLDHVSGRCSPLAMYLERALAKDPTVRLRSAVQVAEALREIARTV